MQPLHQCAVRTHGAARVQGSSTRVPTSRLELRAAPAIMTRCLAEIPST